MQIWLSLKSTLVIDKNEGESKPELNTVIEREKNEEKC